MEYPSENTVDSSQKAVTTVETGEFGEHAWRKMLPTAFDGHCFYVRQDITGESCGPDPLDRHLGGIVIPPKTANNSRFVTVLGIGPKVGTKASKAHRKEFDWPDRWAQVSNVKVGDKLFLGFEKGEEGLVLTNKIKRSPLNWECELFIEESLPEGIVTDD